MLQRGKKRKSNKVKTLSAHLRERQEKIQQTLQCLAEESARGTPIIVEGKKDLETLRTLGIQGQIVTAKTGGKSRLDLISEIEKIGNREVILLLDFDRRGKEWTAILRQNLEKTRIKANVAFRKELLRVAGRELKDIEGLAAYLQTLSKKLGEK
jgi:2,5-diamino-6-(ribosylamino)-4(3H)-pyrimidinone 5'-phosphate reductase